MAVRATTIREGALTSPADTAVSPITRPPTMLTVADRDLGALRPASLSTS